MAKIITIGIYKGGCGKTMTTFNISSILAERGYKVLCMDCDPQGNLTSHMGIDRADTSLLGMERIFDEDRNVALDDIIVHAPIKELPTLDIIPSTAALSEANKRLHYASGKESKIKYFIMDHEEEFYKYDYIFLDTSPTDGPMNHNAFVVADSIVLPVSADTSDINGIYSFDAEWEVVRSALRLKNNIDAIIVVKCDRRVKTDREFHNRLVVEEGLGDLLLDNIVPFNTDLKSGTEANLPINLYNKKCNGYIAYNAVIDELFERGVL